MLGLALHVIKVKKSTGHRGTSIVLDSSENKTGLAVPLGSETLEHLVAVQYCAEIN